MDALVWYGLLFEQNAPFFLCSRVEWGSGLDRGNGDGTLVSSSLSLSCQPHIPPFILYSACLRLLSFFFYQNPPLSLFFFKPPQVVTFNSVIHRHPFMIPVNERVLTFLPLSYVPAPLDCKMPSLPDGCKESEEKAG